MFVILRQTHKWLTALLLATLFFTLLILQGCTEPKAKLLSHTGMTMGTSFTVKWFGDSSDQHKKFHKNFTDPSKLKGTEEEIEAAFKATREEIKHYCEKFVSRYLAV